MAFSSRMRYWPHSSPLYFGPTFTMTTEFSRPPESPKKALCVQGSRGRRDNRWRSNERRSATTNKEMRPRGSYRDGTILAVWEAKECKVLPVICPPIRAIPSVRTPAISLCITLPPAITQKQWRVIPYDRRYFREGRAIRERPNALSVEISLG